MATRLNMVYRGRAVPQRQKTLAEKLAEAADALYRLVPVAENERRPHPVTEQLIDDATIIAQAVIRAVRG